MAIQNLFCSNRYASMWHLYLLGLIMWWVRMNIEYSIIVLKYIYKMSATLLNYERDVCM